MGDVIQFRHPNPRVGGFEIVADGTQPLDSAYEFENKPPAKSSTNVAMGATVCSTCGCSVGKPQKPVCPGCKCHKED